MSTTSSCTRSISPTATRPAAPRRCPNGTVLQPGTFYCASAAMWDMKTNNTRPDGWTSSDAAGLQVLPGLVQYDEVMGPDPITHAHRITLNWSSSQSPLYVWPATHSAGSWSATNPPLGTRLRLKASKDISSAGPHARKVLQAMKDYGVIFADNGGHGMITGTNDPRWGNYDSPIRDRVRRTPSQESAVERFRGDRVGLAPDDRSGLRRQSSGRRPIRSFRASHLARTSFPRQPTCRAPSSTTLPPAPSSRLESTR